MEIADIDISMDRFHEIEYFSHPFEKRRNLLIPNNFNFMLSHDGPTLNSVIIDSHY